MYLCTMGSVDGPLFMPGGIGVALLVCGLVRWAWMGGQQQEIYLGAVPSFKGQEGAEAMQMGDTVA